MNQLFLYNVNLQQYFKSQFWWGKNGENKMEWLKCNAMDCLKYGYGYKSFLEFNDYEKGLISDEEYKKAWHDAMEEMTKDQFAQRIKEETRTLGGGKKKRRKEFIR